MKGEIDLTGCVIVPKGVSIFSSTDLEGKIIGTSPEFLMYSGFDYSELNDENHNIIRHDDMPQSLFYIFWDELKKATELCPTEVIVFVKNKTKFGGFYWVLATARPETYDENGYPASYMSNRVGVYDKADIQWLETQYGKIKQAESRHLSRKELSQYNALSMAKDLIQGEEYEKLIKKYR